MADRIAYFNGEYIKESEVKISMYDRGFLNGDAVFDMGRTYNHQPFKWSEHIDRWFRSLRYMQIDIGLTPEEVYNIALEVFKRNEQNLASNDDYWMAWRATPGENRFKVPMKPTVLIHCRPIPFDYFAKQYADGINVVIVSTRAIPPQCQDPKAKLQSRANYVLAELEARSVEPNAYAVMLDVNGFVAEGFRQNVFIARDGKLLTPTRDNILEGVSRATTLELAKQLDIEAVETNLFVYDLSNADEIFLTTTSFTILPVAKVNSKPLGKPVPGPITKRLLSAWSELVGVDIVEQALSHVD